MQGSICFHFACASEVYTAVFTFSALCQFFDLPVSLSSVMIPLPISANSEFLNHASSSFIWVILSKVLSIFVFLFCFALLFLLSYFNPFIQLYHLIFHFVLLLLTSHSIGFSLQWRLPHPLMSAQTWFVSVPSSAWHTHLTYLISIAARAGWSVPCRSHLRHYGRPVW